MKQVRVEYGPPLPVDKQLSGVEEPAVLPALSVLLVGVEFLHGGVTLPLQRPPVLYGVQNARAGDVRSPRRTVHRDDLFQWLAMVSVLKGHPTNRVFTNQSRQSRE